MTLCAEAMLCQATFFHSPYFVFAASWVMREFAMNGRVDWLSNTGGGAKIHRHADHYRVVINLLSIIRQQSMLVFNSEDLRRH